MDLTNTGKKNRRTSSTRSIDLGTMMYGKIPPQARDLEGAVLGAIMIDRDAFEIVTEILQPQSFYVEANQRIFAAMKALSQKNSPIDLLTVVEELKFREELDLVGGPYYVTKLTKPVTSAANIEAHSRIVQQKFIQRELIRISSEIINDAYEDSTDVFELLNDSERKILEIGSTHVHGGMISMDAVLANAIKKIEEWRQNDTTLTGVPSGFTEIDKATRGWQPGDLIIIAARPSIGKTAFALNIVRNAALNPIKPITVAVWSLEMKSVYLGLRMLAAESKIYLHRIQTGRLDDDTMARLYRDGVNVLSKANVFFDESSKINIGLLSAKARRLKKKKNLGLIVIDYMQLMSGEEKKGNREQEVSNISRELKNLAQELEIPIIALSQLSRENASHIKWEVGPGLHTLRESGAIEQDADVVGLLWGASDAEINQDKTLEGKRKFRIAKQRNGVVITNEFDFKNEIQLFEEIDKLGNKIMMPTIDFSVPKSYQEDPGEDLPF